jgi:hypothetical protein
MGRQIQLANNEIGCNCRTGDIGCFETGCEGATTTNSRGCKSIVSTNTISLPSYIPHGWNGTEPTSNSFKTEFSFYATPGYSGLKWWGGIGPICGVDDAWSCWYQDGASLTPCRPTCPDYFVPGNREFTCNAQFFTGVTARFNGTAPNGAYPSNEQDNPALVIQPSLTDPGNLPNWQNGGCDFANSTGAQYLCAQTITNACPTIGSYGGTTSLDTNATDGARDGWVGRGDGRSYNSVYGGGRFFEVRNMAYGTNAQVLRERPSFGYQKCTYSTANFTWQHITSFNDKVKAKELPGANRATVQGESEFYNAFMYTVCMQTPDATVPGTVLPCAKNLWTNTIPASCLVMFTDTTEGTACRNWFEEIEKENKAMTDTVRNNYIGTACNNSCIDVDCRSMSLEECRCTMRFSNPEYDVLSQYLSGPPVCTYGPCKVGNTTMLQDTAVFDGTCDNNDCTTCPDNCVNLVLISNSTNISLENLNQFTACDTIGNNPNAGGSGNEGGASGAATNSVLAWLEQYWWAILIAVIVIAAIAIGVYFGRKKQIQTTPQNADEEALALAIAISAASGAHHPHHAGAKAHKVSQ